MLGRACTAKESGEVSMQFGYSQSTVGFARITIVINHASNRLKRILYPSTCEAEVGRECLFRVDDEHISEVR